MEVKKIYLDLQEAEKTKQSGRTVWRLESESFKDPIQLVIHYDDEDKAYVDKKTSEVSNTKDAIDLKMLELNQIHKEYESLLSKQKDTITRQNSLIEDYQKKLTEKDNEISNLYKEIAGIRAMVDTVSGTTVHLVNKTNQIFSKQMVEPTVHSHNLFISGHEDVALCAMTLKDGDYIEVKQIKILEKNEYVDNESQTYYNKVHIEGTYLPTYRLEGGTELDTPTATIERTLLYIPC